LGFLGGREVTNSTESTSSSVGFFLGGFLRVQGPLLRVFFGLCRISPPPSPPFPTRLFNNIGSPPFLSLWPPARVVSLSPLPSVHFEKGCLAGFPGWVQTAPFSNLFRCLHISGHKTAPLNVTLFTGAPENKDFAGPSPPL